MKLKSVDVFGLYGRYDHHITLNEEGLTYIHSLNGVGKSTTMKLIFDLYKGDVNSIADTPFRKFVLEFISGERITVEKKDELEIIMESEGTTKRLYHNDLMLMFWITYLSPDRNVFRMEDGWLIPAIDMYTAGFRAKMEEAKRDRNLTPCIGERRERSEGEFIEWCLDLYDRLKYIGDAGIWPDMPKDVRFPPTPEDYGASKERYEDLAYSIEDWIGRQYPFAETVNTLLRIINSLFTDKKIEINETNQLVAVIWTDNGPAHLPLDKLSAGEKQLLIIFFRILNHGKPGSLVILDEPEISLHVSWQKRLGPILLDIIRMRDIQILVATHSPLIIHDRWDLTVELRSDSA